MATRNAANSKEHMVDGGRLNTAWRSVEVLRPTSDRLSGNKGILCILEKAPSKVNRAAESCNEEPPAGSGQRCSDERTAAAMGSKQVVHRAELCEISTAGRSNFPGSWYVSGGGDASFIQIRPVVWKSSRGCPCREIGWSRKLAVATGHNGVYNHQTREVATYLRKYTPSHLITMSVTNSMAGEDKEFSATLPDPAVAPVEDVSCLPAYDTPEENKKPEASNTSGSPKREMSKLQQPLAEDSSMIGQVVQDDTWFGSLEDRMVDSDSEELKAWYDEMEVDCELYGWEGSDDEDCFLEFDSSSEEGSYHDEPSAVYSVNESSPGERPDVSDSSGFLGSKQREKTIWPLDLDLACEDWQLDKGIVRHWACVDFSSLCETELLRFLAKMRDMCENLGMEFSSWPARIAQVASAVPGNAEKTLRDVFEGISDMYAHVEFLLVILPDDKLYHAEVQEACERLEVIYQCCLSYEAWPPCRLYLKDIAREIKLKVVKHVMRLQRQIIPFVPEAPTIIFGADILHYKPGERSIASVVAALNWPKVSKYETRVFDQSYNHGVIQDLYTAHGGMVSELLHAFHSKTKRRAERIIFFRNSVTESQAGLVCLEEVHAIKQACASLEVGYEPPITFLVVSPVQYEGFSKMTNKSQQVLPDTEDGENSFDPKPEFRCRHAGAMGFNGVAHYRVMYNENEITLPQLQCITKMLCTPSDRQTCPRINMAPPAYYAQVAVLNALETRMMEDA